VQELTDERNGTPEKVLIEGPRRDLPFKAGGTKAISRDFSIVDESETASEEAMKIGEKVQADIVVAMKARDERRLTTLRMVKSALKNKEIDKREALTDAEETQILTTLIKQRKESVELFTKGGRPELAEKERLEIGMIEAYLPQAAGEEEIRKLVRGVIAHLQKDAGGVRPGPKDLGTAMQVAQQWIRAAGLRSDGKLVSEIVKAELAK
jgi:uncharacterized protein YqeY